MMIRINVTTGEYIESKDGWDSPNFNDDVYEIAEYDVESYLPKRYYRETDPQRIIVAEILQKNGWPK